MNTEAKSAASRIKAAAARTGESILQACCREYVTLDISSTEVRVMSVRHNTIKKWGSESLSEGLVRDGIILEPQTLSLMIKDLFKSLKLHKDRVICTVTGLPFIYRSINMPVAGGLIDKEALERAARKEMSLTEPDMHLFWQATESRPDKKETDYFVIGVPKHAVNPLIETLKQCRIKPYLLDVKTLALARLARAQDAILISLEKNYVDIVVISGGLVRVMHSFDSLSKPGETVTLAGEVANGLSKAEKSFNREFPQNILSPETPILLSGELAGGDEVSQLLQQTTGHPVSLLSSPLPLPAEFPASCYAGNIGLFLKKMSRRAEPAGGPGYRDINLDLLSGIRPPSAFRYRQSYALGGLAVIVVAGLAFYAYNLDSNAKAYVGSLTSQNTAITAQLTQAQKANKEALALKKMESDKLQSLQAQLDSLKAASQHITGLQRDYAGRIEFISGALPPYSQYQKLRFDRATMTVSGLAPVSSSVLAFTDALEASKQITSARINTIGPGPNATGVTFEVAIKE